MLAESALPLIHPPSFGFRPVCLGTRSGNLMQIVVNLSNTKHLTRLASIRSTQEKNEPPALPSVRGGLSCAAFD